MSKFIDTLENVDAVLVTSGINRRYFTGFNSSAGMYFMTKEKNYFLIDFRYIKLAREQVSDCEVILINKDKRYNPWLREIIEKHDIKTIGIEYANTTLSEFEALKKGLEKERKIEFCNVSDEIQELRNVKTEIEAEKMQLSQNITDQTFTCIVEYIRENYKKGITEKDIGAKLVGLMYEKGAEALSFQPIVASGANGASPHARPTNKKIVEGEFITMDFGCILDGYCSDMTRTVAVGQPSDELIRMYELVLEAQKRGIAAAKAGVTGADIHKAAMGYFEEHDMGQYFGHNYGHGIGLECHEGRSAGHANYIPFPENYFISAEPGLYVEGLGGVRIEDVIKLTKDGVVNITNSRKDLIIIK